MDQAAFYEFLSGYRYGVVSSVASDGSPQSALVGIAITPKLEIIFDTVKATRKYPNLIARPRCSLVIGWGGEQTVQYEGLAYEPEGDALEQFQELYFKTWPDGPTRLSWPGIVLMAVKPVWLRYSDFLSMPPHVAELRLAQS